MLRAFIILVWIFVGMAQGKTLVFIHGGPGFNSEPDRHLLKPYLESLGHRVYLWDEPSAFRPEGYPFIAEKAYDNYMSSSEEFFKKVCQEEISLTNSCKVELIAHSFGAHVAVHLAKTFPTSIQAIKLFSPGLNIADAEKNILNIGLKGLMQENKLEVAGQLQQLLPQLVEKFDETKMKAFVLATQYTALLQNYWSNFDLMGQYFSYLTNAYQIDMQSYVAVRSTMPNVSKKLKNKITVPTEAYFGKSDPVINSRHELLYLNRYFSKLKTHYFSATKHYSYLEKRAEISW